MSEVRDAAQVSEVVKVRTERRGGPRPGSGRKKGGVDGIKKANEIINPKMKQCFPEIPNFIMELRPKEIVLLAARLACADGRWTEGAMLAEKCAGYYDTKLQAVTIDATIKTNPKELTDADLMSMLNVVEGTIVSSD